MWPWVVQAWAVPGAPDLRYPFDAPPPVPDVASGAPALEVVGCAIGGSSFHPAFGTVLECPAAGAANAAPWSAALETGDHFTVATWVRVPDPALCPNERCTFVQQGNTDGAPVGFYVYTRFGLLRFTLHDGAGEEFLEVGALPVGRWTHVVARQDGHEASLFLDGVRQGAATLLMTPVHGVGAPLNVGHTTNRDFDLVGSLDELLLWRRSLSDAEIAELHAWYDDGDLDGWTGDDDCDDGDLAVNPAAVDTPGDGVDQDCSGADAEPPPDTGAPVLHSGSPPTPPGSTAETGVRRAHSAGAPPPAEITPVVWTGAGPDPGCGCAGAATAPAWAAWLAPFLLRRRARRGSPVGG